MDVVATGSFAAGEWPKLQLLIDGVMIGEKIVASAKPQIYRFFAQLSAGAHTLKLALPNHTVDSASGQTRNLWITRLLMFDSGTPLPVPGRLNAVNMTIKSHGDSLGSGVWNLFANGFLAHGLAVADSGEYTLQVEASAHEANGEGPKLVVTVDGVASDTVEVAAGSSGQFNFPLTLAKGNHLLQLKFINNFFDPVTREDRDLILHEFSVSRMSLPQTPKVVINDEAVARQPNAVDTDDDVADFAKRSATIGMSNDANLTGVHGTTTAAPKDFVLDGNYPNPFNPATQIKFGLPEPARVVLAIHNINGQEVACLFDGELTAGEHRRDWNAEGYVTGLYFVRLVAIRKTSDRQVNLVKKMIFAK